MTASVTLPVIRPERSSTFDVRFVVCGLAFTTLGGTSLGAVHLALSHGFGRGWPLTHVQAHAHAQIFGFFAAFLFGFGYELLPRFVSRPLPFPRLARASFWLLMVGAALHFVGQPANRWEIGFWIWGTSAPFLATAGLCFAANVFVLLRGLVAREQFDRWVRLGAFWLTFSFLFGAYLTLSAVIAKERLMPLFQAQALWAAALYGGIVLTTLGVAARLVMRMLGGGVTRPGLFSTSCILLLGAVPLEVCGLLLPFDWALRHPLLLLASGAMGFGWILAASAFAFPLGRPWAPVADRFFSAALAVAFSSLAAAGVLRIVFAAADVLGRPAGALALDAGRHLLTVGFLIVLTLAVAQRLVPALVGRALRWPALRWCSLALIVAAVLARSSEILAELGAPSALRLSAVSGVMTWGGLVAFAVMVLGTLLPRAPRRAGARSALYWNG